MQKKSYRCVYMICVWSENCTPISNLRYWFMI